MRFRFGGCQTSGCDRRGCFSADERINNLRMYQSQIPVYNGVKNGGKKMDAMSFLTLVVFAFALVMLVAGIFSAYFGSGKSKAAGGAMAIIGLVVGIVWAYLVGFSDISPFCDVNTWDTVYVAIISLIGILIGALVAVGIFLVVVLKS